MLSLKAEEIEDLIHRMLTVESTLSAMKRDPSNQIQVIGSLLHNVSYFEREALEVASGRMGCHSARFAWDDNVSASTEDILRQTQMYSRAVDLLVTGYADSDTFGAGRQLIETIQDTVDVPVVNMADDIYAPQSALAVATAFWQYLGGLKDKRIAISWGFGSRHVLPTTAHSLSLLCASLGVNLRVVAPNDFSLLNRVMREVRERAQKSGSTFEEQYEFEESFTDVDAVFALNWGSLDDANHPERNSERAANYRHWHFTQDILPTDCAFVSIPPIQAELLASNEIVASPKNLTIDWFARRVDALIASISFVTGDSIHKALL